MGSPIVTAQGILEEVSAFYVERGDDSGKNEACELSETIEKELQTIFIT